MIDEQTILTAERLRDELVDLRSAIRKKYKSAARQITSNDLQQQTARLAETWLVELAPLHAVLAAVGEAAVADLNVHFQRMLTFAEHATTRGRYDAELRSILDNYSVNIIVPLKQSRGKDIAPKTVVERAAEPLTAFVGQSFSQNDEIINKLVFDVLTAIGVTVATGEKPKADRISEKVKSLIEQQAIFVGIFTRRDKIARKKEWATSTWVIDEKAYALGRQKRLILLKEQGVNSIGGIQGDYEYFEFSRDNLGDVVLKLVNLFSLTNNGLQA
jgi:hypothetical protein